MAYDLSQGISNTTGEKTFTKNTAIATLAL